MPKKKQHKASFIASLENDPVVGRMFSIVKPSFDEVQFIILFVAVLFAPVNGTPLIRYLVTESWTLTYTSREELSTLLSVAFTILFIVAIIAIYVGLIVRRSTLTSRQKAGTLLIVYMTLSTCALFGALGQERVNPTPVDDLNYAVSQVAQLVLTIRFWTTMIALKAESTFWTAFFTKNFSDKQASLNDILMAILSVFSAVFVLNRYGYGSLQTIVLGYVYGFMVYKAVKGLTVPFTTYRKI